MSETKKIQDENENVQVKVLSFPSAVSFTSNSENVKDLEHLKIFMPWKTFKYYKYIQTRKISDI